ncbi:MAG TPA: adenosylcobinamide-GDP ribazoletransferase [Candidatus Angelobacter sp.]|nr:adenosylcobinamide-GDP ribazoletransferase [Candidatus Angelobacter sp.]
MKRLVAAVMFLTRLPVPGHWDLDASDVGRAAAFFPLIGAGIGAIQCGVLLAALRAAQWAGKHSAHLPALPAPVLAVILVTLSVLITGALHLDGLADMADGFGGGRTRDDVLRIMRDHAIGAYGAIALVLALALKIVSIVPLIEHNAAYAYLVVAPALARGSIVVLGFFLPYARSSEGGLGGSAQHIGVIELLVSSATALALAFWLINWRAGVALFVIVLVSLWNARLCWKKIQGMTGDTLGANAEVCETLVLAAGAILTS